MARILSIVRYAERSNAKQRHAAAVYKSGRRLSVGYNRSFCHHGWKRTYNYPDECGIHAEVAALKKAPHTDRTTVYVVRVNLDGATVMSRPCPSCQQKLEESGVKDVVYSTSPGTFAKMRITA